MRTATLHVVVCLIAVVVSFLLPVDAASSAAQSSTFDEPAWPTEMDGRPLRRLPAELDDDLFVGDTGGFVARFTDGDAEVMIRWAPSHHFHASSGCFRALGWEITPAPRQRDTVGRYWTAYFIERDAERRLVTERVQDARGRSWADPMEWYWASLLGRVSGPAFAYTVVRDAPSDPR